MSSSNEEIEIAELEKAVREYKRNKLKLSETKEKAAPKKKAEAPNEINKNQSIDDSADCWTDLQKLKSYFLMEKMNQNKKPVAKNYAEYERQGAIPKYLMKNDLDLSKRNSKKKVMKKHEKKLETDFKKNYTKKKSVCAEPKMAETESSLYTFTVNPALDDVTIKLNDEVCSMPFFYIVPENPSSNFFFSPGSYFVMPEKMLDSQKKDVIIFHPTNSASVGCQQNDNLSKSPKKLNGITEKNNNSSYQTTMSSINDLGKEVPRKKDCHLNIGPLEAKQNELYNNLDISCASNKTYEKTLLNPLNFTVVDVVPKVKSKRKFMNGANTSDFIMNEDDLRKVAEEMEMLKRDKKNFNENSAESNSTKEWLRDLNLINRRQGHVNLTHKSFSDVVALGKQASIADESLFENMVLALPEIPINELQEKFLQFRGNETLIKNYIQETKKLIKIHEHVLDMQLILPEADPDFLYQKIVKLMDSNDDNDVVDAINALSEELLDNKEYPKVSKNNRNSKQRGLWQKYVQNFDVKDFILKVPDPQAFAVLPREFCKDRNKCKLDCTKVKGSVVDLKESLGLVCDFLADLDLLWSPYYYQSESSRLEPVLSPKPKSILLNFSIDVLHVVLEPAFRPELLTDFAHAHKIFIFGPKGDGTKASMELILKFLISRYPTMPRDSLENLFKSKKNNLTNTCVALSYLEPVSLSKSSFEHEAFNEAFLQEVCYIDHKEEIDKYLEEIKERKNLEIEEALLYDAFLSCPLCGEEKLIARDVVACPEGHIFCKECIKRYILIKLGDGIYKFLCPSDKCDAFFLHTTLEELLPENVLSTIIKKQQFEEISNAKLDGCEFCPNCEFAYIPDPKDKIFRCQNPECLIETCRKCHEKNHIPLRCDEIERSMDIEARKKIEESMTEKLLRTCPTCLKKFVKIDGCNKMMCTCGTIVCYICRQKIEGYSHFTDNSKEIRGDKRKCPLYSNNETLHVTDIISAGIEARNRILQENPDVRIKYDPLDSAIIPPDRG